MNDRIIATQILAAALSVMVTMNGCGNSTSSVPNDLMPIVDADVRNMMTGGHVFDSFTKCNENGQCKDFRIVCVNSSDGGDISRADSANGIQTRISVYGEFLFQLNGEHDWTGKRTEGKYVLKNGKWLIVETMHEGWSLYEGQYQPACPAWRR